VRTGTSGSAAAPRAMKGRRTAAGKRARAKAPIAPRTTATATRIADGGSEIPRQVPVAVGTAWNDAPQSAPAAARASATATSRAASPPRGVTAGSFARIRGESSPNG
jgi:hypothetical protein